ncbi:hypothetical protein [Streptomyces thioluteus]|uniref:hypothetical protein n=1 Tax=Streptomyces thioluteus TaxID=66431 RepID=UPI0031E63F24
MTRCCGGTRRAELPGATPPRDLRFGGQHHPRGRRAAAGAGGGQPRPRPSARPTAHRPGNRSHLAFSAGPHTCPARDPARLIAHTAVDTLINRLPDLRLAVPARKLTYRPSPWALRADGAARTVSPRQEHRPEHRPEHRSGRSVMNAPVPPRCDGSDLHGEIRSLRARGPVVRVELPDGVPAWVITRYDLLRDLLTDPRIAKDPAHWDLLTSGAVPEGWPLINFVAPAGMITADGADHRRLRALVSQAFTPRRIAGMRRARRRPSAPSSTTSAGTRRPNRSTSASTTPTLAMRTIGNLLGVPPERYDEFRALSASLTSSAHRPRRGRRHPPPAARAARRPRRREAGAARRGHHQRPDRRAGGRRPALRGRAHRHPPPHARRGPRHDPQPRHQRGARPAHPPRPAGPGALRGAPLDVRHRGGPAPGLARRPLPDAVRDGGHPAGGRGHPARRRRPRLVRGGGPRPAPVTGRRPPTST